MDLVYECFVKLGLRYICILRDGRYAGMVGHPVSMSRPPSLPLGPLLTAKQTHKKRFAKYMRELEEKEGRM